MSRLARLEVKGSVKNHDGYMVWEVWMDDHMISSFYGPMSFMATAAFVKFLVDQHGMSDVQDVLEQMTRDVNTYYCFIRKVD